MSKTYEDCVRSKNIHEAVQYLKSINKDDRSICDSILSDSNQFLERGIKKFLKNSNIDIVRSVLEDFCENGCINDVHNYVKEFAVMICYIPSERIEKHLNEYENNDSISYLLSTEFNLKNSVFTFNYLRSKFYFEKQNRELMTKGVIDENFDPRETISKNREIFSEFVKLCCQDFCDDFDQFIILFNENLNKEEMLEIICVKQLTINMVSRFLSLFPEFDKNYIIAMFIKYCNIGNLKYFLAEKNVNISKNTINNIEKLEFDIESSLDYYETLVFLHEKGFKIGRFLCGEGDARHLHYTYGLEYGEIYAN